MAWVGAVVVSRTIRKRNEMIEKMMRVGVRLFTRYPCVNGKLAISMWCDT